MSTPATADSDDLPVPPGVQDVSLDEALRIAVRMHQQRRLEGAQQLYERILEASPGQPYALCFLGVLRHEIGHGEEGVRLIREAISRLPDFAGFHNNLGNVLVQQDRFDEAAAAYEQALTLDPDAVDACNNLGTLHRILKRFGPARACFERAIAIAPANVRAWNNLGLLAEAEGRLEEAVGLYLKALDLVPGGGRSAHLLGITYYKLGRIGMATSVFRQWLEREPDDPVAAHMYAACSGQGVPERASNAYVEREFDNFAASFERVLGERLNYQAPRLCAEMIRDCLPPPARRLQVLDAGCGTGLCGPLVAPWAASLTGVDLSAGMLDKARNKGVYDELVKAELTEFLQQGPARWDLILSADTLCYFGKLEPLMRAGASALRPGGVLVFTVEAHRDDEAPEPAILPNGRYAHGRAYLERALAGAGLQRLQVRGEVLRDEGAQPVRGWLVAAGRPA